MVRPAIPPLVVLSIFGLYSLHQKLKSYFFTSPFFPRYPLWGERGNEGFNIVIDIIISGIFIFSLSLNLNYLSDLYHKIDPFSYLSGQLSREQYIEKYRVDYAAIKYVNENLSNEAKILVMYFGNRRYYFNRSIDLSYAKFYNAVKYANSAEEITSYLQQYHFTHLMLRYELMNNWIKDNTDNNKRIIIQKFFDNHTITFFKIRLWCI